MDLEPGKLYKIEFIDNAFTKKIKILLGSQTSSHENICMFLEKITKKSVVLFDTVLEPQVFYKVLINKKIEFLFSGHYKLIKIT